MLAPAPFRRGVDRLAHLVHACGANDPTVLMEAQTRVVPCKPEEIDQTPRFALEIIHDHFVVDFDHPVSRQYLTPVRHQFFIGSIELPEFRLIVSEWLVARELLAVARQAGIHWIAPAMDDSCIGQDRRNQTGVQKVCRHLVNETYAGFGKLGYVELARTLHAFRR